MEQVNETNEVVETQETETPTLTQDSVKELIAQALTEQQKEFDRNRTEYGKKTKEQEAKIREEYENKLKALKSSTMTDAEKHAQELEDARNALTQKERDLLERENKLFAVDALNKADMPLSFLEFVTSESEDVTTDKINTLKSTFDAEVQKAVDDAFKNKGRTVAKGSGGTVTVQDFAKMTYQEKVEIFKKDPELYNKLSSGN